MDINIEYFYNESVNRLLFLADLLSLLPDNVFNALKSLSPNNILFEIIDNTNNMKDILSLFPVIPFDNLLPYLSFHEALEYFISYYYPIINKKEKNNLLFSNKLKSKCFYPIIYDFQQDDPSLNFITLLKSLSVEDYLTLFPNTIVMSPPVVKKIKEVQKILDTKEEKSAILGLFTTYHLKKELRSIIIDFISSYNNKILIFPSFFLSNMDKTMEEFVYTLIFKKKVFPNLYSIFLPDTDKNIVNYVITLLVNIKNQLEGNKYDKYISIPMALYNRREQLTPNKIKQIKTIFYTFFDNKDFSEKFNKILENIPHLNKKELSHELSKLFPIRYIIENDKLTDNIPIRMVKKGDINFRYFLPFYLEHISKKEIENNVKYLSNYSIFSFQDFQYFITNKDEEVLEKILILYKSQKKKYNLPLSILHNTKLALAIKNLPQDTILFILDVVYNTKYLSKKEKEEIFNEASIIFLFDVSSGYNIFDDNLPWQILQRYLPYTKNLYRSFSEHFKKLIKQYNILFSSEMSQLFVEENNIIEI